MRLNKFFNENNILKCGQEYLRKLLKQNGVSVGIMPISKENSHSKASYCFVGGTDKMQEILM